MQDRTLIAISLLGVLAATTQAQNPQFRSATDVVVVEAQVSSRDGLPVAGLTAKDFDVTINGHRRSLVSVDFINAVTKSTRTTSAAAPRSTDPDRATTGEPERTFVIALDEGSFTQVGMQRARLDVRHFVDKLGPADRVGLYRYPCGTANLEITRDREVIYNAIDHALGCFAPPVGTYYLGPSEIIDMSAGDKDVGQRVINRECGSGLPSKERRVPPPDPQCAQQVRAQVQSNALYYEQQAAREISALTDLFRGLAQMPERKTVVLVSAGLTSGIRVGARVNLAAEMSTVFRDAAAANANVYVLHLDDSAALALSSRNAALMVQSQMDDGNTLARGLEQIAAESHGSFIRVRGVAPDYAFDQILRETTAYYVLGVATLPEDRDGRVHFIRVSVKVKHAEVLHRLQVVIPK